MRAAGKIIEKAVLTGRTAQGTEKATTAAEATKVHEIKGITIPKHQAESK